MTANRQLAAQRAISQENIEAIDALHAMLEKLIASYTLEILYEEARDLVHSANMTLSNLWGFTYDSAYDTWTPRFEQRHMELVWVGRTFKCQETGAVRTIEAKDVGVCRLWGCGKGCIDFGRPMAYSRIIGDLVEITHLVEAE
jgi:hypothetical protein